MPPTTCGLAEGGTGSASLGTPGGGKRRRWSPLGTLGGVDRCGRYWFSGSWGSWDSCFQEMPAYAGCVRVQYMIVFFLHCLHLLVVCCYTLWFHMTSMPGFGRSCLVPCHRRSFWRHRTTKAQTARRNSAESYKGVMPIVLYSNDIS